MLASAAGWAEEYKVNISAKLPYIDVRHEGKTVRLQRNQDTENMVDFDFSFTSRPCPPFCIQPIKLAEGVETVGELELIDYLRRMTAGDDSIVVIDSRVKKWVARGMIPGAINIPWTKLHPVHSDPKEIAEVLEFQLGAAKNDKLWNFEHAKTLVLYCNGMWCGQSPSSIRALLIVGYPAHKLKWYRGGMQAWKILGLTTVISDKDKAKEP
ncbi:MAG: rhodanese-like domain-containing protein [Gammaproteobacteria bacterium]|nr:rhodanese-like domain-containing protein [Gammaproteobacteria bacterium]